MASPKECEASMLLAWIRKLYRKFIWGFSHLAQLLNQLLKKDQPFIWTDEAQQSFDNIKKCFTEEPVLMMPDQTKPFQIECDASKWASGAVLTQLDINGDQHPCAFISWTFSLTEQNYEIYDWELLSVIRALQEWHHYIQGSNHKTIIYSDHKNLTYFRMAQKLNCRQARWSLLLSEFDIKLIHLPGDKMILSDTLSQQPDFVPDKDTDNEDMILLPDKLFRPTSLTISVCKSGLKTAKRPQPDRTKTGKDRTSSPVFWFLRIKDHKKTGLHGPVFAV